MSLTTMFSACRCGAARRRLATRNQKSGARLRPHSVPRVWASWRYEKPSGVGSSLRMRSTAQVPSMWASANRAPIMSRMGSASAISAQAYWSSR